MSKKAFNLLSLLFLLWFSVSGQNEVDSSAYLKPVNINAYFSTQPLLSLTSSAKVISSSTLNEQVPGDYLSAMNMTPGLRMEERSPGSYRLAIRGSMIRSPFGIRNIKIFMDDFPITDAGGNTYLNLFDPSGSHSIHVIKGPDGSIYGPNSGGIVRFTPNGLQNELSDKLAVLFTGGSFGHIYQSAQISKKINKDYQFSIDQSFSRSDGYRENSDLNKKSLQTAHRWNYSDRGTLKGFALFTDLRYQTPGGLTPEQYEENPASARPAAGPVPGAKEQKAGIINKTIFSGLSNTYNIHSKLKHHISVFGSYTDFENPFITNYEFRKEKNIGVRTYISYQPLSTAKLHWKTYIGAEGQKGKYDIKNYDNEGGVSADPQAFDLLSNAQNTLFLKNEFQWNEKLFLDASIGWNKQNITFKEQYPEETAKEKINIPNSWMPRIGLSYQQNDNIAWRASLSKGFSPPTIAEIRGSDNVINTDLHPEEGTNYEAGWRWQASNRRIIADLSAYLYRMNNGIVKQLNEIGADFYRNAGIIDQKGLEAALMAHVIKPNSNAFINSLLVDANFTLQRYRFKEYTVEEKDYAGNKVTAVPDYIYALSFVMQFHQDFHLNLRYNHTSSLPLNDANTYFADAYHLLQAKLNYRFEIGNHKINTFIGGDNLLDQKYSLGNDINAFGNRFYNAAAPANIYGGLGIEL